MQMLAAYMVKYFICLVYVPLQWLYYFGLLGLKALT